MPCLPAPCGIALCAGDLHALSPRALLLQSVVLPRASHTRPGGIFLSPLSRVSRGNCSPSCDYCPSRMQRFDDATACLQMTSGCLSVVLAWEMPFESLLHFHQLLSGMVTCVRMLTPLREQQQKRKHASTLCRQHAADSAMFPVVHLDKTAPSFPISSIPCLAPVHTALRHLSLISGVLVNQQQPVSRRSSQP